MDDGLDDDVAAIEHTFERFSENFRGTKVETLVAGYKAEKRLNPAITPDDYLEGLTG